MNASRGALLSDLESIVKGAQDRPDPLQDVAARIRSYGNYRWAGLYKVDYPAGMVRNLTWSGPGAPAHPTFPSNQGLTGAAIAQKQTVNVGDVSADCRYLTAFGTTRSEIIVPVFDVAAANVVGTIDIESEQSNAFSKEVQDTLEACSLVIQPLWHSRISST